MKDKTHPVKYFEVPVLEVHQWTWKDYMLFVLDALYSTVLPFIAGMVLVHKHNVVWGLLLIIPIYFKFHISKTDQKKTKRIYVK